MSNLLYMKNTTLSIEDKMADLFNDCITKYERLLSIPNSMDVVSLLAVYKHKSEENNSNWILNVFSESLMIDMQFSVVTDYFAFIGKKVFDLKAYKYMHIKEETMNTALKLLQSIDLTDDVNDPAIEAISQQIDKHLPQNSIEYRLMRCLMLFKKINLLTSCNSLARFAETQNKIVVKDVLQISIDANVSDR